MSFKHVTQNLILYLNKINNLTIHRLLRCLNHSHQANWNHNYKTPPLILPLPPNISLNLNNLLPYQTPHHSSLRNKSSNKINNNKLKKTSIKLIYNRMTPKITKMKKMRKNLMNCNSAYLNLIESVKIFQFYSWVPKSCMFNHNIF